MALIFPFTRLLYSDFLIINGEQNHRPPAIDPIGTVAAKSRSLDHAFFLPFLIFKISTVAEVRHDGEYAPSRLFNEPDFH